MKPRVDEDFLDDLNSKNVYPEITSFDEVDRGEVENWFGDIEVYQSTDEEKSQIHENQVYDNVADFLDGGEDASIQSIWKLQTPDERIYTAFYAVDEGLVESAEHQDEDVELEIWGLSLNFMYYEPSQGVRTTSRYISAGEVLQSKHIQVEGNYGRN